MSALGRKGDSLSDGLRFEYAEETGQEATVIEFYADEADAVLLGRAASRMGVVDANAEVDAPSGAIAERR